ncbi:Succinate dehydrogenase/fumarate reductase, flavoprotein subunit [Variovorax sp. HW608]|uniref:FAD-dependent oxidoreductase n=1 Tax=Variovorax sp. HW608 TaxID=1034889 RepID=UPI00081FCA0B|nr:FAD-dependent oxidoreductase [Variovorax sp. HW608]SCK29814.1 Succinate dehydrogenase/fumarate reductase, flavoprotein subunit [Variovorax sp. HW608]
MHRIQTLASLPQDAPFDVVVIGAGGAGMATALFAALEGRKVLLVERTSHVGGTTALSAGTTWVPGTRLGAGVNPRDTIAEAGRYLDNAIGARTSAELRQAFLDHGAEAIEALEAKTDVRFRACPRHPDYISDLGGSTVNGRALEPMPFDGRLLGELFPLVRPPIPEFTVLGGMMVDRTDINHLLGMSRSVASLRHSARILGRHAVDRLRHARGTRLVMGNALVARLLYSLAQRDEVSLALDTNVERIERAEDGIDSIVLKQGDARRTVRVRGGVVLASGGFNRDPARRAAMLPGVDIQWCPGAPGHTGEAHPLAEAVGARYGEGAMSPAFWAPVSRRRRADGSTGVFPHFVMDRAKPGMLTVNRAGERFVNESTSYHLFGLAMQKLQQGGQNSVPAFLVCDADALRKYGIGMVRPGAKGLAPYLADGYLVRGETIESLAQALAIDPVKLAQTARRFNANASQGIDPDFHRGSTVYSQNIGDASWPGPNPCLGPLTRGPFYAVRLYPGDIGAAAGFATDANARALDAAGAPIEGLYAVGNDMHSIMGGVYTAPGITIGPGIVFARLAARHAAARAARNAARAEPAEALGKT